MKIPFLRIDKTIAQKYPPTPDEVDLEYDPETDSLTLVDHTGAKSPLGGGAVTPAQVTAGLQGATLSQRDQNQTALNFYANAETTLLGEGATNNGTSYSVAVGKNSASSMFSVAVGEVATASTGNSVAVGYDSRSEGESVAVGAFSYAKYNQTAVGPRANSLLGPFSYYSYGVSLGNSAQSVGQGVAVGGTSSSVGLQRFDQVSFGLVDVSGAVAVGYDAVSEGSGVAVGLAAKALGYGQVHIAGAAAFAGNFVGGVPSGPFEQDYIYMHSRGPDLRGHHTGAWDMSYDSSNLGVISRTPYANENYEDEGPNVLAPGKFRLGFIPHGDGQNGTFQITVASQDGHIYTGGVSVVHSIPI